MSNQRDFVVDHNWISYSEFFIIYREWPFSKRCGNIETNQLMAVKKIENIQLPDQIILISSMANHTELSSVSFPCTKLKRVLLWGSSLRAYMNSVQWWHFSLLLFFSSCLNFFPFYRHWLSCHSLFVQPHPALSLLDFIDYLRWHILISSNGRKKRL